MAAPSNSQQAMYAPPGYAPPPAGYAYPPPPGYAAPPPQPYGVPPPGYASPPPGYGMPPSQGQYAAPPPGYSQPPPNYAQSPPQQNYGQPPQYTSQPPPVTQGEITYDPTRISYREMTVDQWNDVPNDKTDYSDFWATPDAFQPQTFSKNENAIHKCNDLGWTIVFWINFCITIGLMIWIATQERSTLFFGASTSSSSSKKSNSASNSDDNNDYYAKTLSESTSPNVMPISEAEMLTRQLLGIYETPEEFEARKKGVETDRALLLSSSSNSSSSSNTGSSDDGPTTFTMNDFWKCVGYSFLIGLGLNAIHLVYALFAPGFYVRFALILNLILSIAFTCVVAFVFKYWYFWIFPAIYLIFAICWFCIAWQYVRISAAILTTGVRIVMRFPGTILITILWGIVASLISIVFCFMFFACLASNISQWIYIYFIFSFLWISFGFYYTIYVTIAGVSASWYFLNDTEFMPRFPTIQSFKRAISTSFGSAAEAAFILALIRFCEIIVSSDIMVCTNGIAGCIFLVIRCCLLCILRILYRIFGFLNRYALIYCATFGVPYKEGCRRFGELSVRKFIDVLCTSCVLEDVLMITCVVFAVVGAVIGWAIGCAMKGYVYRIWYCIFCCLFTFAIFMVFQNPLQVTCDTLLICFGENPEKLATSAAELAEALRKQYSDKLEKKLRKPTKNKKN